MPRAAPHAAITVDEYLAGERADRSDKFYTYRKLPTLQEYVLVAQDEPRIEVYRRATGWDLEVYGPGERFRLDALGGDLDLDAVYAGILPLPADSLP